MGYNIVANNGDYLQTLYKWSIDKGVYIDHIHHTCECDDIMLNHHF